MCLGYVNYTKLESFKKYWIKKPSDIQIAQSNINSHRKKYSKNAGIIKNNKIFIKLKIIRNLKVFICIQFLIKVRVCELSLIETIDSNCYYVTRYPYNYNV